MGLFNRLFGKKEPSRMSNAAFWAWFQENEQKFAATVRNKGDVQRDFFAPVTAKLKQLRPGFFLLTGMYDPQTVELIITAEGVVHNLVWVEELIAAAPTMAGWRFTAHKPAIKSDTFGISMGDYTFSADNLSFHPVTDPQYPDEIHLKIVHPEWNDQSRDLIENGCLVFLDNYLGELLVVTQIDRFSFGNGITAKEPLVPITKLLEYLQWRQAEFVEKHEGTFLLEDTGNFTVMEAELRGGGYLIATMNQDLLQWDRKASHPWMMILEIRFQNGNNGMPDEETARKLATLEEQLDAQLPSAEGFLNIGHQTSENTRVIYHACKDFRKPSKAADDLKQAYQGQFQIEFDIFKDKYWRSVDHFRK